MSDDEALRLIIFVPALVAIAALVYDVAADRYVPPYKRKRAPRKLRKKE